jgi:hypothetical protein
MDPPDGPPRLVDRADTPSPMLDPRSEESAERAGRLDCGECERRYTAKRGGVIQIRLALEGWQDDEGEADVGSPRSGTRLQRDPFSPNRTPQPRDS